MSYGRRRRRLFPAQVERMVGDFIADRDRRTATIGYRGRQPRFGHGQRVRFVGGHREWVIAEVVLGRRVNRYRLEGWQYLTFESDLAAASDETTFAID